MLKYDICTGVCACASVSASRTRINSARDISIVWICVGSWERDTTLGRFALIGRIPRSGSTSIYRNLWPLTSGLDRMTSISRKSRFDRICRGAFIISALLL